MRPSGDFRCRRLGGKAFNAIIGGMRQQNRAGFPRAGFLVILEISAIGRANLNQPSPTFRHYIRQTKTTADLD